MDQKCIKCGSRDELRFGICFDCASSGEGLAARRSVAEHICQGICNLVAGSPNYKIDFAWAWERFTCTGDYKPGGTFERQHGVRPR